PMACPVSTALVTSEDMEPAVKHKQPDDRANHEASSERACATKCRQYPAGDSDQRSPEDGQDDEQQAALRRVGIRDELQDPEQRVHRNADSNTEQSRTPSVNACVEPRHDENITTARPAHNRLAACVREIRSCQCPRGLAWPLAHVC